ncbi:hypothetical protein COTS27_01503 [Spirochaetota bacterium]|nr:hypothetical protein COTS27_01503 [Spirochaetota bacterium]
MTASSLKAKSRQNAIIVNGTVIAAEVIEREWRLIKEQLKEQLKKNARLADGEVITNDATAYLAKETLAKTLTYAKDNVIARCLLEWEANRVMGEIPYEEIEAYYKKMEAHFGGAAAFSAKVADLTSNPSIPVIDETKVQNFSTSPADRPLTSIQAGANLAKRANSLPGGKEINLVGTDVNSQPAGTDAFTIKCNIEKSLKIDRLITMWERELPELTKTDFKAYYDKNQNQYLAKERVLVTVIETHPRILAQLAEVNINKQNLNLELENDDMLGLAQLQQLQRLYEESCDKTMAARDIIEKLIAAAKQMSDLQVRDRIYFERGILESQVEAYLFSLNDNQLSGLVRAGMTIHLFWKWSTSAAGPWAFSYVYDRIKRDALTMRRNTLVRNKLALLRKAALIEDQFLPQ